MNLQWIGVEAGDKEAVLGRLGFEIVGEGNVGLSGDFICTITPDGWLILVDGRSSLNLDQAFAALSAEPFVLGGVVVETVNYNHLRALRNGITQWSVTYDAERDQTGFVIEGTPPSHFAEICQREEQKWAEGGKDYDYLCDTPIYLGQSICGYPFDGPNDLTWNLLFKVKPVSSIEPRRHALSDLLRSELDPFLAARGWESDERPAEFVRRVDGQEQTIVLEIVGETQPHVVVRFEVVRNDQLDTDRTKGVVDSRPKPRSFLNRLLNPKASKIFNPMDQAIRGARADILIVERFLETGERSSSIIIK